MKPTLTLQPSNHRQQDAVRLHVCNYKPFDEVLIAQAEARWNDTTKGRYPKMDSFNPKIIVKAQTTNAFHKEIELKTAKY